MHIPDLELYCYNNQRKSWDGVLAIGWLDSGHEFTCGETTDAFKKKLEAIRQREHVNTYRGYHHCHLCREQGIGRMVDRPGRNVSCCEVWVPAGHVIYAAPELISHYIQAHKYLPPAEFINAVMDFDLQSDWSGETAAKSRRRF